MQKKIKQPVRAARSVFLTLMVALVFSLPAHAAVNFVIQNTDAAGVGFNDTSTFSPQGGNFAVTFGQARKNAFYYAAAILGAQLTSGQTITIDASMPVLFCDASSALLGQAGTLTAHRDFGGAPLAATWYTAALANTLSASDLNGGTAEIQAQFNSQLDSGACLGGQTWYYGFDRTPGGNQSDFVSVLTHELLHGLGVASFADASSGALFNGMDDAYTVLLEDHSAAITLGTATANDTQRQTAFIDDGDLHWTGANVVANSTGLTAGRDGVSGHVQMYAPTTVAAGSSVSHFDTAVAPDELMEPFYTGANHSSGLAAYLLQDIGWAAPLVSAAAADLNVAVTPNTGTGFASGDVIAYRATINNAGAATATAAGLVFFPQEGSTIGTITPSQGTCNSADGVVTCYLGDIAAAGSATVDLPITLGNFGFTTGIPAYIVTARVFSGAPDAADADNLATEILLARELTLKDFSSSGGGCTFNRGLRPDPMLPALILASLFYLLHRRRTVRAN